MMPGSTDSAPEIEPHNASDRALAAEQVAGERCVDDDHAFARDAIACGDESAGAKRDAQARRHIATTRSATTRTPAVRPVPQPCAGTGCPSHSMEARA